MSLPAGESRVALPVLAGRPHTLTVTAEDAAGRVAVDRAQLVPRGWLADEFGRAVARGLVSDVLDRSYSGGGILRCRRIAGDRIDCELSDDARRCDTTVAVKLGADGRLRWGTYRCGDAQRPRLRRLRRSDYTCQLGDPSCPPPVFGVVADRWLVPWG
jgi:hypothetical protein